MEHRFLIIQTAFIGDVVLATGVVEKLHQAYPEAQIDLLIRKGNEALLKGHPIIGRLHIWDKKTAKYPNLLKIIRAVRRARYTHIVNIHRFATSGLVTLLSGAPVKSGFDKNPFSWCYTHTARHIISKKEDEVYIHDTERNQALIAPFTDAQPEKYKLYPSGADYEKVQPFQTEPYICIAPSSVWFTKRYPAARWTELINALPPGQKVWLLGGPDEAPLCEEIIAGVINRDAGHICGRLNLLQSAALMQGAIMNYTNDSGPLHFAAAVDAPVTGVFTSTHSCYGFTPISPGARVVEVKDLYCKPCGIHGHMRCPEGHFRCAKDIALQDLL